VAAPRPLTTAEMARIRELHAAGHGRNAIARELRRSPDTISRACAQLGLDFDRSASEVATAARVADARARRARLQLELLDDAERLRAQIFAPTTVFAFGGRDNVYNERQVVQPPVRDQRDLVHAVSTAVAASLRLAEHDADTGADDAKSMLGALAAGLRAAYEAMPGDADEGAGSDADPAAAD
jgi:hypothetical protein